ncbi:hypothetical protein FI667_g17508, partial [Globisporangium splendens]
MPGFGSVDDDVDMTILQPIYEFVKAPRLGEWSQQALVRFVKERNQYEEKIKERCRVTGEAESNVTSGLKSSLDPRILDHLSHYILKKSVFDVTDGDIRDLVEKKIGRVNVQPDVLRVEITRLTDLTHRNAKIDDSALHDLLVDRATRQQQYHLIQGEVRGQGGRKHREATSENKEVSGKTKANAIQHQVKNKPRDIPAAPRSRCWVCKGEHWLRDCPIATDSQKAEAKRKMAESRERRTDRLKRVTGSGVEPVFRTALVNGVLEVPFCPDTGADTNIVGRAIVAELADVSGGLAITSVDPPVEVRAAGGELMHCRESVSLNLQITTAAGPLQLQDVKCLILDGEEELLIGTATLKSIGIDMDRLFEQLAERANDDAEAGDIPSGYMEVLGTSTDGEVQRELDRMVNEAMENGFNEHLLDELRQITLSYSDVWRTRVGADEAAAVEPLNVHVHDDATPHRTSVRRYPEPQRQFLREYVRELEQGGLVYRNNHSRWACAALPVRKSDGGFRITVDYRPVNRMTVPIAGVAPNLAVATQCVQGAYGFGRFDFHKGFWQMPLHPDC